MVKVILLDWVNEPENVAVYEGTELEVEIHLRSRFMKDTMKVGAGDLDGILKVVKAKFGIHVEAWKKVA
jgi:hypothetical protein